MNRISLTEYRDNPKSRAHQKYRNKITETADGRFDSEAEHRHWCHLKLRLRAGEISDLRRQVVYELIPSQKRPSGGTERACNYIADFVYQEDGQTVVADVKGFATGEYVLKRKLMLFRHGIEVREIRARETTKEKINERTRKNKVQKPRRACMRHRARV
jgi:hypothetical protein